MKVTDIATSIDFRAISGTNGAIWGTETTDLDATLVRWEAGAGVGSHRNDEVDVVMVVLEGHGYVVVSGIEHEVCAGWTIVIPKSALREIQSTVDGLTYLNIHKRRRGLMPNMTRPV